MKALVTGATGFTGNHLARRLAAGGDTIRALARDPARAADLRADGIEVVAGDLTDRVAKLEAEVASLKRLIKKLTAGDNDL